jgi:hypothetical protein
MVRDVGAALLASMVLLGGCGKKKPTTQAAPSASANREAKIDVAASTAPTAPGSEAPRAPAGSPPPDGKYERVVVEGVTVPMIHVMNNGAVVLVDTDGKKPRSWEEQYKRKRESLLPGQFDIHKTNSNKNDTFDDDAIDKEGLWVIDSKGNITRH